jgi:uncharacterized membrane protein
MWNFLPVARYSRNDIQKDTPAARSHDMINEMPPSIFISVISPTGNPKKHAVAIAERTP